MSSAAEIGLFLNGTRCSGCVRSVESAFRKMPGVLSAAANYTTHRVLVTFDATQVQSEDFVSAVEKLGYSATPYDPQALDRRDENEARSSLIRILVAAFLAGNVMLISAALYIGSYQELESNIRTGLRWLAIALSIPAIGYCALPFWKGAWVGIRRGQISVDILIVLGISTAFIASVFGTINDAHHIYMDSAAMIVFLILLGRTLERRARGKISAAVDALAAKTPAHALRKSMGKVEKVRPEELEIGDIVIVPAGETVPADGVIVVGTSELDESLITGESSPVVRGPSENVIGGTQNTVSELTIEIANTIKSGTLSHLTSLLERAQSQRPEVQQLADRIASVFAPTVLVIAALTVLFWWQAGQNPLEIALTATAVLIVACPCALGLATPAAITAAVGRASQLGVLIRNGLGLERLASVDTALLDKTGTVTQGRFQVEEVATAPGIQTNAVLAAAAQAEGNATHPIAVAIRETARKRSIEFSIEGERTTFPGLGVTAGDDANRVCVGSQRFLRNHGVTIDKELIESAQKLHEQGLSLAWVSQGKTALGVVGLWDPPRSDAQNCIQQLEHLGLQAVMLTGDHEQAARHIAGRSGINTFIAELSPEEKVHSVEQYRKPGKQIVMLGDGINDAAALAAADVGIAMSQGSSVTVHAADMVISSQRLSALSDIIQIARATLRRIRENLGFALLYNAVAIPLAALGVLEPLHAAIAMSLSSLVVTGNALRLTRWRSSIG